MKKRKPLTKKQILAQARGTAVLKRYARSSPFTTLATLCNYTLWKNQQATRDDISEYNAIVAKIYEQTEDPEILEQICDYLWENYQIKLVTSLHTPADWLKFKNNKFTMQQIKDQCLLENELSIVKERYIASFLAALVQMGKDKKYIKDSERYMIEYTHGNSIDPKNMRIEMEEAIGLKIEEPA